MTKLVSDRAVPAAERVFRFGQFELHEASGDLLRSGRRIRLQEQPLRILLALLERPGEVVSREELCSRLWPEDTFVDFDQSLNAAVKRLRRALGDDAENARFVETLPKRGYRFLAPSMTEPAAGAAVEPSLNEALAQPPSPHSAEAIPLRRPGLRQLYFRLPAAFRVGALASDAIRVSESASEAPFHATESGSTAGSGRRRLMWAAAAATTVLIAGMALVLALHMRKSSGVHSAVNFPVGTVAPSQNSEAYELYLRSLSYKLEPPANGQAILLLERSTALDPNSARPWYELARRYYFESEIEGKGQRLLQQAREANRRALVLAPDFSPALQYQVLFDVEAGQLGPASSAALAMSRAHPQDGYAHFAMSYVLRYGGMFEDSAQEFDLALKLDSTNASFRSCSLTFVLLGQFDRASVYLDLDPLSTYARFRRMELALLTNHKATALELAQAIRLNPNDYPEARLLESVLGGAPRKKVLDWSRASEAFYDGVNDSEEYFVAARYQSWAGQTEPALRLLRRAIANSYCSFPAMDSDPMLANVRGRPEYAQLRRDGAACRESFRVQMQKTR